MKQTDDGTAALAACAKASKKGWATAMKAMHALPDDVIASLTELEPVRRIVREADRPDVVRSAIYWLGRVGSNAAAAAVDIAAAIPRSENPWQAHKVIIDLGATLTPELRDALRAHLTSDRSEVVKAATAALTKLGDAPPEVPIETRIARVRDEISSRSADTRWSGFMEAKRLGPAGGALIEPLRTLGDRVARKKSLDDRVELDAIRDALVALGCPPEDLPRPPSRFESYRGNTPRELGIRGGFMVGQIEGRRSHGVVSVPTTSLGLWDKKTGKLLFVAEDAPVLDVLPNRQQAAIVRTSLRTGAKHGGTSRGDYTWTFERLAIPSGERVACLELPKVWTNGWAASLQVKGDIATLFIGDEDSPFKATLKIADTGDTIVMPRPNTQPNKTAKRPAKTAKPTKTAKRPAETAKPKKTTKRSATKSRRR